MFVGEVVADVAVFYYEGLRVALALSQLLVAVALDALQEGVENGDLLFF